MQAGGMIIRPIALIALIDPANGGLVGGDDMTPHHVGNEERKGNMVGGVIRGGRGEVGGVIRAHGLVHARVRVTDMDLLPDVRNERVPPPPPCEFCRVRKAASKANETRTPASPITPPPAPAAVDVRDPPAGGGVASASAMESSSVVGNRVPDEPQGPPEFSPAEYCADWDRRSEERSSFWVRATWG